MTRLYGRAPRGIRIHEATSGGYWQILTFLGALGIEGMLATITVPAATDAEISLTYLDRVLCPKLRPGQAVVLDNSTSTR